MLWTVTDGGVTRNPTEFEAGLLAENKKLARHAQHLQSLIDALMLEHCPDEMTPEQITEWERCQKALTPNVKS